MKNTIKMSLIAAVAVAGLTTTSSAANLEDTIKGVDASGMIRYRYEHAETDDVTDNSATDNDYDLELKLKTKVNDTVSATVKIEADAVTTTADGSVGVNVTEGYFTAKVAGATVMAGKQGVPGPFDDGETGTGVVALVPVGPVTLAAGHFENHSSGENALGNGHANEIAVIGAFGAVKVDAWHLMATDVATMTTVHASAKVGPANIDARYTTSEIDVKSQATTATNDNKASLTKVVASAKFGAVSAVAGFAVTGENNGQGINRIGLDNDNDAKTDFKLFQHSAAKLNDATAILVGASTKMGATTVGAKYLMADFGSTIHGNDGAEGTELLFDAAYKMSKNFKVSAKYSMATTKASTSATEKDHTKSRIEVKYTF